MLDPIGLKERLYIFCRAHLPLWVFDILFVHKYAHFFATGATGVAINLLVTWGLTEFVFGLERYFQAYLVGLLLNLLFNFILHATVTFKTKDHVLERMVGFVAYSLSMTLFQAWVVKTLTPIIGIEWYLLIIASVILSFSVVTFAVFKFFLFRGVSKENIFSRVPYLLLVAMLSSLALHLTFYFEAQSRGGMTALISGDAIGYVDLAKNLWEGKGFSSLGTDGILEPEVFRTPGLPLLLAPFTATSWGIKAYLILQTIFASIIIPLLVYLIGRRVFSPKAGMVAAWLIALEPQIMFASWSPLTEIPFLIGVLSAFLLYHTVRDWKGCRLCFWVRFILAGGLAGYAILIRPGAAPLVFLLFFGLFLGDLFFQRKRQAFVSLGVIALIFLTILPWQIRNAGITGSYSLSGAGWRNVYTDYLSAIRVVEESKEFSAMRQEQKEKAKKLLGVSDIEDIGSPRYSRQLRDAAVPEIWEHKETVFKLESLLLLSYFTNDNYYNQLIRLGFIERVPNRRSPSQILLQDGLSGVPRIVEEMRKQYFIPVVSRLYQFVIMGLALLGLWRSSRSLALLLGLTIGVAAVTSTVIGFGVEARLRMPIMPILFLLAGHAITVGLPIPAFLRRMKPHES